MEQIFVTPKGKLRGRWQEAFPDARLFGCVEDVPHDSVLLAESVLWLDIGAVSQTSRLQMVKTAVALGGRVVAMDATPGEVEAFKMLSEGAVGYCHVEASPQQLKQISTVVHNGGVWMMPSLVQRLMSLSMRVVSRQGTRKVSLNELTQRELAVARLVASGATNREASEALGITERTVKAHMSAIFGKLGVRDRVQLALAVNKALTE